MTTEDNLKLECRMELHLKPVDSDTADLTDETWLKDLKEGIGKVWQFNGSDYEEITASKWSMVKDKLVKDKLYGEYGRLMFYYIHTKDLFNWCGPARYDMTYAFVEKGPFGKYSHLTQHERKLLLDLLARREGLEYRFLWILVYAVEEQM